MNGWLQRQAAEASWKLEAGSWKLEAGSWKLEAGSWKLEAKSLRLWLRREQDLTACCAADPDLQLGQHPMAAKLPHQTLAFGFWLEACSLQLAACCLLLAAFRSKKRAPEGAFFRHCEQV